MAVNDKKANMVVLDGDSVVRVAKKLDEILAGENIAVVMQALAMLLMQSKSFERREGNTDAQLIRDIPAES